MYETNRPLSPEERQAKIKRLKRKKKRRIAIVAAGFLLLLCILLSPVVIFTAFRIKNIEIDGKVPYSDREIQGVAGIALEDNLITFNADKAEAAIKKGLPYVAKAEITKKLPGTLSVKLTKATESYALYVENTKNYLVLDKELRILKTAGSVPKGAVILRTSAPVKTDAGVSLAFVTEDKKDTKDTLLALLNRILAAIQKENLKKITVIDVRKPGNILIVYDGRILLELASQAGLESKINLATQVLEQENGINPTQQGTVNLTIAKKAFFEPNEFSYLMPGEVAEKPQPVKEDAEGETDNSDDKNGDSSDEIGESADEADDSAHRDEQEENRNNGENTAESEGYSVAENAETRSYGSYEESESN